MPRLKKTIKLPTERDALVRMHVPLAIHDEIGYENNLEIVNALTNLPGLTAGQLEYLETLSILVADYESKHHAIDTSGIGPIESLSALMEANGMSASDLGRLLGDRALGSRILNGNRELSKAHIRILAAHFAVRADLFL